MFQFRLLSQYLVVISWFLEPFFPIFVTTLFQNGTQVTLQTVAAPPPQKKKKNSAKLQGGKKHIRSNINPFPQKVIEPAWSPPKKVTNTSLPHF